MHVGMNRGVSMNKSLISFVITSFNQRDFILNAVAAAFAQTYRPLEIIVADDHSTDGSVAELKKLIDEYKSNGGPHDILLHVNDVNQGVLRNCEAAFAMARGELIVLGGGDDVSHVDRVETIARHWVEAGKKPTLVFHDVQMVDINGKPLNKEYWQPSVRNPLGAAMAFSPVVVKEFSRSVVPSGYEDNVFARRAFAFGDPLYLSEKLVDYRQGAGSTTAGARRDCRRRISHAMVGAARQSLLDVEEVKGRIPVARYENIRAMMEDVLAEYTSEYAMVTERSLVRRLRALMCYAQYQRQQERFGVQRLLFSSLPLAVPSLSGLLSLIYRICRQTKHMVKACVVKKSS